MKNIFLLWTLWFFLMSCSSTNETSLIQNSNINDDQSMQSQKTILALWDSLTAWYWLEISESYPNKLENILSQNWYNYKVINAWVSGDTSKNLLDRANLYLDQNPDIVLLVIWWNDGLRWQSIDELKANIQSIIDLYKSDTQIVLWGVEIPANFWLSYTREFKKIYFDISKANKDIYFLESFLKDVGWVPSLNQADRIHPTSEWYDIIVKNMYEFLQDEDIIQK